MKFFIAFSAVLALAAARPGYIGVPLGYAAPVSVVPLTQYHSQDTTGQYAYGYASPLSAHAESRLGDITSGSYSYIDAEGHLQSVTYRADAISGFRVAGTNIPQAPAVSEASRQEPAPVQDTPEVVQAREEHMQAVEAIKARDASLGAPAEQQTQDATQQADDAAQQAQDSAQQAEDAIQQQRDNAQLAQDAMQQEQDNAQQAQDMAQQAQDQANEAQDQANEQQNQAVEHAQTQTLLQLPYIYNYAPIQPLQYIQPYSYHNSYIQPSVYSYSLPLLYTNGHPVSDLPQDDANVLRARAEHQAAHQQVRANLQAAGAAV